MTAKYLQHFGLEVSPFAKEIADEDLWMPPSKEAVVEKLVEAMQEKASAVLTGEPGVGKTCVLRALRHRLPQAGFRLTYCHNATLGRRDFYRQLCFALGLSPSATAASLFYAVTTHVEELGREQMHPVMLLDEAHLMHQDTLDHLHILLNYEWDRRPLLSLILVGLPDLSHRLERRRSRSLYSRLHCRLSVDALCPDDTAEYIRFRLESVGCTREIFTSDAIAMLHEAALGSLREIDRVATAAMRSAARKKRKLVERDIVEHILAAHQGADR
jgi:type II secretory pathway predicted ATPase ExeA